MLKVVKISKYDVLVAQNLYSLLQVGTTDNYVVTAEKQMYVLVQRPKLIKMEVKLMLMADIDVVLTGFTV